MSDVTETAATCGICFLLAVASIARNLAGRQLALFPRFRTIFGGSVQETTESAKAEAAQTINTTS